MPLSAVTPLPPGGGLRLRNGPPRPPKTSAIEPKLRQVDAAEVMDAKGRFARWAPLTLEGLCGHTCRDSKLCNAAMLGTATHTAGPR